ncbi:MULTISPECIES: hypothetical protein [unclassified Exiguobacterium]|uniref:hypothetical protein n=1 Tax=unclassified Exiguobacterium TaxID=2644629 RepID=UPI00103F61F1|nr:MULTISPECIES: hypothetical protein [unclassified Exiguobacterium]TCI34063.1 hypothetical protein EVJ29_12625 [Exiguobacterium sp. SH4S7]TCI43053.1 hypothetical protein EVJ31_12900 [Exiguobacterium sp. SH5S32]TCI49839.1 hypothetical protein EVJ25_13405 [Exiguobacterium sp. SH1S4]TCI68074.1 hypothetical protein EVJ23_12890 [Exiguobacterium sp. SH1S1]
MVDHTVRLERMIENDQKRQKQTLYPTFGFIALFIVYFMTTEVLLLLPIILVGQFPMLYKSWHRMKLLLTFNDAVRYQQKVRSEFGLAVGNLVFLLLLITSSMLGWITLLTFIIVIIVGLITFMTLGFRIDRELKTIDPQHVTGIELSKVQRERKK